MKTSETDIGYVLFTTPYREHDAMVHFLGQKLGLVRYVLRGFYKSTSKQQSLGLEFSKVRIMYSQYPKGMPGVRSGELINAYLKHRENYNWLLHMQLMSELIIKCHDNSSFDWLDFFETSIETFDVIDQTIKVVNLIRALGISPVVDRCVLTGDSKVADFSIEHGGFVGEGYRFSNLSLDDLRYIRYIFITKDYKNDGFIEYDSDKKVLNILIKYIEYHMGVKINTWKLVFDV